MKSITYDSNDSAKFQDRLGRYWISYYVEPFPWIETPSFDYATLTVDAVRAGKELYLKFFDREPNCIVLHDTTDISLYRKLKREISSIPLDVILERDVPPGMVVVIHLPATDGGETIDEGELSEGEIKWPGNVA